MSFQENPLAFLGGEPVLAPADWKDQCRTTESSLHQLSPYIGKLKSRIASSLIADYTKADDVVVDPFSGAGTIPLEALIAGRNVFCSDISPYAEVLTTAKLYPPPNVDTARSQLKNILKRAESLPVVDLRAVPNWVRRFFHPETLREAVRFSSACKAEGNQFIMACFLGILHHQRPGFLSYPSSHLVPYLRDNKFPKDEFPEMYEYREIQSRLFAKIERVYKRFSVTGPLKKTFRLSAISKVRFPEHFDAVITSPPYMNALDYGRDNRLRLWFLNGYTSNVVDNEVTKTRFAFREAMQLLAKKIEKGLRLDGHAVLVVGEALQRSYDAHPAEIVSSAFKESAPSLTLVRTIADDIPDIRRARRECRGVKRELVLVYKRLHEK